MLERSFQPVLVSAKTGKESLRCKRLHDRHAQDTSLPVGARVFLTDWSHQDRHKIQEVWSHIPHHIFGRPDPDGHVFSVEPLQGNANSKIIQMTDILNARDIVDDLHQDPLPISADDAPQQQQENSQVVDSSEDERGYALFIPPEQIP